MIVSSSLGAVPFISNTDTTRLQMSGKQLNQSLSHTNCDRPYVIGSDYKYLSDTSKLFKATAHCNGKVVYSEHDITIVFFDNDTLGNVKEANLKIYETPKFKSTADGFAVQLHYIRPVGDFKEGDIIYEYDSFKEGIPSFGYNMNTAFMPWFGMNFEDAIVISESAAKKMKCTKLEKIVIPIYTHSLFRILYPDSKYGFIPEVGQKISDNVVYFQNFPKDDKNKSQLMKAISLWGTNTTTEDTFLFNSTPKISKLNHGTINKMKIHHVNKKLKLADEKNLGRRLTTMCEEYDKSIENVYDNISNHFGEQYARRIISSHFIMQKYGKKLKENIGLPVDMRRDDLVYVIEIEVSKEYDTKIGDKLSTRYAGKGVISQIIPDNIRPINIQTKEPIDIIMSPLGVFSRILTSPFIQ